MTESVDFSLIGLFMNFDFVEKVVVLLLVGISVWSWGIIIDKFLILRKVQDRVRLFEKHFWSDSSIDDLYKKVGSHPGDPMSTVFVAGMKEWKESAALLRGRGAKPSYLYQRVHHAMHAAMDKELDQLEMRLGFLASAGSVSPFVGLFGTVWGIMVSFHAIGVAQNTSLPVIAPGIAAALAATAMGLIAAIPAVFAYNKFSGEINRLEMQLSNFSGEFGSIISRQIDQLA